MTTHHFQARRPQRYRRLVGATLERCIYCEGTAITKKGQRRKKLETMQLWYCHACNRVFTPQRAKGKTYPLKVILEALMLYYRGETRKRVAERIKERFGVPVPPRTLSAWLAESPAAPTDCAGCLFCSAFPQRGSAHRVAAVPPGGCPHGWPHSTACSPISWPTCRHSALP